MPDVHLGAVARAGYPDVIIPEEHLVPVLLCSDGVPVQDVAELLEGVQRDGVKPAQIADDATQNCDLG